MLRIIKYYNWIVEKDLFAFPVLDIVLKVLIYIAIIPIKTRKFWVFFYHIHIVYLLDILVKRCFFIPLFFAYLAAPVIAWLKLKIGIYSATMTIPTIAPITTMRTGSIRLVRALTKLSTISS